jgi:hypothetical protein
MASTNPSDRTFWVKIKGDAVAHFRTNVSQRVSHSINRSNNRQMNEASQTAPSSEEREDKHAGSHFISVSDVERSIAFYTAVLALGITTHFDYDGKNGPPGHPDLRGFRDKRTSLFLAKTRLS